MQIFGKHIFLIMQEVMNTKLSMFILNSWRNIITENSSFSNTYPSPGIYDRNAFT